MKLRFVKFFTSRENEIERKEEGGGGPTPRALSPQLGRSQSSRSRSRSSPPPSIIPFSLTPPGPTSLPPPSPQLALRHVSGEQYPPAISSPAVPLLPSFFIKLPKRQSGKGRTVAEHPAVLPNDNIARPSSPATLASSSNWMLASHPGPKGGPSTAGEAIGKQRPKMNYSVSSPSLMNK